MILYLHGFRSSPQSSKARLLAQHYAEQGRAADFVCPQLPVSPRAAIELARQLIDEAGSASQPQSVTLIGSSLGGLYAIWLARHFNLPAVLLNPVVPPLPDFHKYVGNWQPYHQDVTATENLAFVPAYIDELHSLVIPELPQPSRHLLIAARDDDVLSADAMIRYCEGARQCVFNEGGHALSNFSLLMPQVTAFCDQQDAFFRSVSQSG